MFWANRSSFFFYENVENICCYGQNVCSPPPNSLVEVSSPTVMVFGVRGLWSYLSLDEVMTGLVPHEEEASELPLCPARTQ